MFFCVLLSFTKNWWSAFSSISRRRRRGETFIFDLLSLKWLINILGFNIHNLTLSWRFKSESRINVPINLDNYI